MAATVSITLIAKIFGKSPIRKADLSATIETYQNDRNFSLAEPSIHQLERFIRDCAVDSFNIAFTSHATQRMKKRGITNVMVLETLRFGCMRRKPEPDIKYPGLKCRMERLVSGKNVGVEVSVEYPTPDLTIITVINLGE